MESLKLSLTFLNNMDNALEIKNLKKVYKSGTVAVDDLSFTVKRGEFFGFLGANGAGKTTTINCITGIAKFSEGTIKVFDTDVVSEYREARKKIGLSPQEFNVDIFATTRGILGWVGGFYGMRKKEVENRTEFLIDKFELEKHADKKFMALSGGLKRRVMLARAMIHDPELLILDEPTAGVDVELRHSLWKYLQEINAEGKTILLTSHYLEEVEMLCNRIGMIHQGELVKIGTKEEFIEEGSTLEKTYLNLSQNHES